MSDQTQSTPVTQVDRKVTPKLNAALAKAQAEFVQPDKNKTVKVNSKEGRFLYETKYADLKNVIEAFRGPLTKNGLSFTHKLEPAEPKGWDLVLVLRHESGEYDESRMPINLDQPPQQVGSQLTYLKRYQVAAYFGIAADDDDDANGAHGNQAEIKDRQKNAPAITQSPPKTQPVQKQQQNKPVEVEGQPFPPDDVPTVRQEAAAGNANDPAEFVMPIGDVKGKKLKELGESQLKSIRTWAAAELAKVPPVGNVSQVFEIQTKVKSFLDSVGVK